jgi:uncharacterized RDD family membrane protein YckC
MSFLGLEISEVAPGYRKKRFASFLIDVAIVIMILFIAFKITGKPDFPSVKLAMNAAKEGASGPNAQVLENKMFSLFNEAYSRSLMIGFIYEVLAQLFFSGATIGKLIMKLRIVSMNPNRGLVIRYLLMIVRSFMKFAFLYIFQGFPFFISVLSIFTNKQSRTGYDMFAKTYVKDLKER